jgi:tetratricopeptide (TPR) repeat protein
MGLVGCALSGLCVARWGLADDELFAAVALHRLSMTMADWAVLRLALGDRLITRTGVTTIADSSLKQAIETRYLSDDSVRRKTHEHLAAVFWEAPLRRRVQELPWHLEAASAWSALRSVLIDPDFLEAAWHESAPDLARWWDAVLAREGGASLTNELFGNLRLRYRPAARITGLLLRRIGRPREALAVIDRVIESLSFEGGSRGPIELFSDRVTMLIDLGRMNEARSALTELEHLSRLRDDSESLRSCLGLQVVVTKAQGDTTKMSRVLDEFESLSRRANDEAGIAEALLNRGEILAEYDSELALEQLVAAERLWRAIGDYRGAAAAIGHQAIVWRFRGDLERAVELHRREQELSRAIGDRTRLEATLTNQASIAMQQLDFDGAITLLHEVEGLCRESGHTVALVRCLISQGGVFYNLGLAAQARLRLDEALALAIGHNLTVQTAEVRELLARL